MDALLRQTYSLCPICQQKLSAAYVRRGQTVCLEKTCPIHGEFSAVVWNFQLPGDAWVNHEPPLEAAPPCPEACGLCSQHRQDTCCVVLEVTKRCNLSCRFCFADGQGQGSDVPLPQLKQAFQELAAAGKSVVQLSGGEPTTRADLPEIIRAAKQAGLSYVQLNTNGLRLAEDPAYAQTLAAAGLSFVFLQFDGLTKEVHQLLRGRDLLAEKERAIANCDLANLGVTLVVTLVPAVNTEQIGEILRYAWRKSPAVRGVNLQPVSYFGRIPGKRRDTPPLTLDQLAAEIERQTQGVVQANQLVPAEHDHPLCGFHGDFVIAASGRPHALSRPSKGCSCQAGLVSAVQKRQFLARRWLRKAATGDQSAAVSHDLFDLDYFAERVQSHGFTITAIAFQDAGNLDLERLQRCRLHVYDRGKMVPFCAHYYTPWRADDGSTS